MLLGDPERSWVLPYWGVVAVVPILSLKDKQWPGAFGGHIMPSCASSSAGGPAAAVRLPPAAYCAALLCAQAGDQQPLSPQGPAFQLL